MRVMGNGRELPVGSTGPVSPPGVADRLNDTPGERGAERSPRRGLGGVEGHPKVQQRGQGRRSRAPRGVFSEGWGDERPQPAPPHTVWFIGSSHTHTKYVHKHKYRNVHIYMGPLAHPGSRLWVGGPTRGWHEKAGTWRRARSCSPPLTAPPKRPVPLQQCWPGRGQTPAVAGVPGVSSDLPIWLSSQTLPGSLGLSLCVSCLPQGLEGGGCPCPGASPGPSGLLLGLTGGWGCGAARRRCWCHWPALCWGQGSRRSPPRGSRAG